MNEKLIRLSIIADVAVSLVAKFAKFAKDALSLSLSLSLSALSAPSRFSQLYTSPSYECARKMYARNETLIIFLGKLNLKKKKKPNEKVKNQPKKKSN
jgi:hypothetical protein